MLPKDDLYIPPMNIKVKDHRSFGRKPIVGYHIIKSFELYRCDPSQPTLTIAQSFTGRESTEVVNPINNEDSVSTSAVPLVISEASSSPPKKLVRKTMRKRVKHFLKKFRPSSQKSIKTPSKLTQIQNVILKHQFKYHQMPLDEMVRRSLTRSTLLSLSILVLDRRRCRLVVEVSRVQRRLEEVRQLSLQRLRDLHGKVFLQPSSFHPHRSGLSSSIGIVRALRRFH